MYPRRKEKNKPLFSLQSPSPEALNSNRSPQPELDPPTQGNASTFDVDLLIALIKGNRSCFTWYLIQDFVSYHHLHQLFRASVINLSSKYIPTHISEALSPPQWNKARLKKCWPLKKNGTSIDNFPKEKCIVGCKWVFTIKHNLDDTIQRDKTRLVRN